MDNADSDLTILRYLEGDLEGEELAAFERSLKSDAGLRESVDRARRESDAIGRALTREPPAGYADGLKSRLRAALDSREDARARRSLWMRRVIAGAASALSAAAVLFVAVYLFGDRPVRIGRVASVLGRPEIRQIAGDVSHQLHVSECDTLETEEEIGIRTREGERLVIALDAGGDAPQTITIDESTRCVVRPSRSAAGASWRVESGRVFADIDSRELPAMRLLTSEASFRPLGTVFQVERLAGRSVLTVAEGSVEVTGSGGRSTAAPVTAGHEAALETIGDIDVARVVAPSAIAWARGDAARGRALRYRFREGGEISYAGYYDQKFDVGRLGALAGIGGMRAEGSFGIDMVSITPDDTTKIKVSLPERGPMSAMELDVGGTGEIGFARGMGGLRARFDPRLVSAFGIAYGMFPRLPDERVVAGSEWRFRGETELLAHEGVRVCADLDVTYTCRGDSIRDGERVVLIDVQIDKRDLVLCDPDVRGGEALRIVSSTGTGSISFAPRRGVIVKTDYSTKGTVQLIGMLPGLGMDRIGFSEKFGLEAATTTASPKGRARFAKRKN